MKKEKLSFYNAASKIWDIFYSPSERQKIKQDNAKMKQELTLMNLHAPHAPQHQKPVFIVEGFFDCINIVKLGFDAVALMGSSISQQQLTLLKEINRFYILMLDGDEAGEKATIKISNKMAQSYSAQIN